MTYREPAAMERYEPPPSTGLEVCMKNIEIQHRKKYNQILNQMKRASERGKRFINIGLSDSDAVDCGFSLGTSYVPNSSGVKSFNPNDLLWLKLLVEQGFKISFESNFSGNEVIHPCYPYRIIVRF